MKKQSPTMRQADFDMVFIVCLFVDMGFNDKERKMFFKMTLNQLDSSRQNQTNITQKKKVLNHRNFHQRASTKTPYFSQFPESYN